MTRDTSREYVVVVCGNCLRASCWHGEQYCDKAKTAGTTTLRARQLDTLGREPRSHYAPEKIRAVTGAWPEDYEGLGDAA